MFDDIRDRLKKATPGPWRWQDRYDFREHLEHRNQGLDAKCENIEAGRITLEPKVLSDWASYADDSGLNISRENADFIAHAPADISRLLAVVDIYERALEFYVGGNAGHDYDSDIAEAAIAEAQKCGGV